MTTSTLEAPGAARSPVPTEIASWMYRFSVAQYQRMVQTGILSDEDKVELLNGWVVEKMPRNPPHDMAVMLILEALRAVLPVDWLCRGQSAVTASDSEPEPDVAVVRGPIRRYADHHPGPEETALIVEVADSSLARDRNEKGPIYARDGIPVYWIVNIPDGRIEVYTDPSGPADNPSYRKHHDYQAAQAVPVVVDG